MPRLIPAEKRISRAKTLIQQAKNLPVPSEMGSANFAYVAEGKDLIRQARDLVKLIPYSPSATPEMKAEVAKIIEDAARVEKEIIHKRK